MTKLMKIVQRAVPPVPWAEGDNIPWNDPAFSERMLAEHLSQDHDLASRRTAAIERHADWIFAELLGSKPARVLDLTCGPGLYTGALAERGCECVGLDFSPASIRHAEETAAARGLACTYRLADVRDADYGDGFDLALMIYAQINVFRRPQAEAILRGIHRSLKPGGLLLLEPQTYDHVYAEGGQTTSWYAAEGGLFSPSPHVVLQEGFWDPESSTRTERFHVVDAASGEVETFALPTVAYRAEELRTMVGNTGFQDLRTFASLAGDVEEEPAATYVVVGGKSS
jgi:SAM-dependent methyltransferase